MDTQKFNWNFHSINTERELNWFYLLNKLCKIINCDYSTNEYYEKIWFELANELILRKQFRDFLLKETINEFLNPDFSKTILLKYN